MDKKYITYAEAEKLFEDACKLGEVNYRHKTWHKYQGTTKEVYVLLLGIRPITDYYIITSYKIMVAYWVTVIVNENNRGCTQYEIIDLEDLSIKFDPKEIRRQSIRFKCIQETSKNVLFLALKETNAPIKISDFADRFILEDKFNKNLGQVVIYFDVYQLYFFGSLGGHDRVLYDDLEDIVEQLAEHLVNFFKDTERRFTINKTITKKEIKLAIDKIEAATGRSVKIDEFDNEPYRICIDDISIDLDGFTVRPATIKYECQSFDEAVNKVIDCLNNQSNDFLEIQFPS